MKINGKIATKNEELTFWTNELKVAREDNNLGYIRYTNSKVKELVSEARVERILEMCKE